MATRQETPPACGQPLIGSQPAHRGGLLDKEEVTTIRLGKRPERVDYGVLFRERLRFCAGPIGAGARPDDVPFAQNTPPGLIFALRGAQAARHDADAVADGRVCARPGVHALSRGGWRTTYGAIPTVLFGFKRN